MNRSRVIAVLRRRHAYLAGRDGGSYDRAEAAAVNYAAAIVEAARDTDTLPTLEAVARERGWIR